MMKAEDWHKIYLFKIMFTDGQFIMQDQNMGIDDVELEDHDSKPMCIRMIPQAPAFPDFRMPIIKGSKVICFRRIRNNLCTNELVNMRFMIGHKQDDVKTLKCVSILDRKVVELVE